jgi:hypothetical protein
MLALVTVLCDVSRPCFASFVVLNFPRARFTLNTFPSRLAAALPSLESLAEDGLKPVETVVAFRALFLPFFLGWSIFGSGIGSPAAFNSASRFSRIAMRRFFPGLLFFFFFYVTSRSSNRSFETVQITALCQSIH